MADIFISYAREDASVASQLAHALESAGFSIWWDDHISGGSRYLKETEAELKAARAVIVVWTQHSIESHWVADEAAMGRDTGRLVPISTDGSMPPLGFRQFQVLDFAGWKGGQAGAFPKLLSALDRLAPRMAKDEVAAPAPVAPKKAGLNRTLLIAGGVLGALVLAGVASLMFASNAQKPHGYKSIAVLAFKDQSAARDQAYFAEGMAEALLNRLTRSGDLKVAASTSSFVFKDKPATAQEIARQLGVEVVLEGSVQTSGDKVRVLVQMVDGGTGFGVWSDNFENDLDEIFALQDAVSNAVATQLKTPQLAAEKQPGRTGAAVFALYRGEFELERGGSAATNRAVADFQQAIALEPEWALPHARVAFALSIMGPYVATNAPMIERELEIARKYDRDLPELHFAEAIYRSALGDVAGSRRATDALLAVDNKSAPALMAQMGALAWEQRFTEAEALIDPLTKVDPLGAISRQRIGLLLGALGRNEEAVDRCQAALPLNEFSSALYVCIGNGYAAQGRAIDAVTWYLNGLDKSPDDIVVRFPVAQVLAQAGFLDEALGMVAPAGLQWPDAIVLGAAGRRINNKEASASVTGFTPVEQARIPLLAHDLKRALPLLKQAYAQTPDAVLQTAGVARSFKPYLLLARMAAGDLNDIDKLKEAIRTDLASMDAATGRKTRTGLNPGGQVSTWMFFVNSVALASLGERDRMYAMIDQMLDRDPVAFEIHDVAFDGYRNEPRFKAAASRHAEAMKRLHRELLDKGLIDRVKRLPPPPSFRAPGGQQPR